jgi:hypothetical protein
MGYWEEAAEVWKSPDERVEEARERHEAGMLSEQLGEYGLSERLTSTKEETGALFEEFAEGIKEAGR